MADMGISTLGVTFSYGVEATAGTKPTSFTTLHRINSIGSVSIEPEKIDASALEDKETKYIPGRADTGGGNMSVVVNLTNETLAEWEKVIEDYVEAKEAGKKLWFQSKIPGLTKANFVVANPPERLPKPENNQNELQTMEIQLTIENYVGFDTAV